MSPIASPAAATARIARVDDDRVDLLDHPEPLGRRQERARRDHVAVVVEHPQQDLELRRDAGLEVDDRLRDEREALLVDRDADALRPRHPALHARLRVLVGRVHDELVAPRLLGVVHREVGGDEHVLAAERVAALEHRDADARGDRAVARPGHGDPLGAQRLEQVVGDALGRGEVGLRQQHGELVAAQPRQHVGLAQPRREQLRDARDDVVAGLVAERVVDVLEVVEVEQQQRALVAVAAHEIGVRVELARRSSSGCAARSAGRASRGTAGSPRSGGGA